MHMSEGYGNWGGGGGGVHTLSAMITVCLSLGWNNKNDRFANSQDL